MATLKETTKPAIKTYQLDLNEGELVALVHAISIFNMEHTNPYGHTNQLELLLQASFKRNK